MKKTSVKSALVALVIMLTAFSAFAVDFSASTNLSADLWGTDGFKLGNPNQKDADLLTVNISDEVWGSYFRFYTAAASDSPLLTRSIAIWVKPVPVLKIKVGAIGNGLYTESLDYYQVPNGNNGFASDVATAGDGIDMELTAVENLWILAGICPGIGNALMVNNAGTLEVGANTKFGVAAKYTIAGFGSVGAAYRNNGGVTVGDTVTWNAMTARVGVDINAVSGLYAFVTAICSIEAGELAGLSIDNYAAFTAGDLTIKGAFPVTVRIVADNALFMCYDLKVAYKLMENVTGYGRIEQNNFALEGFTFTPTIKVGAEYSIGKVSLDTALQIVVPATGDATWSIPCSLRASW
jgi:hypothetical protein